MSCFLPFYSKLAEIRLCRRSGLFYLIIPAFDAVSPVASGPDAYFASRFSYDAFYRHADFLWLNPSIFHYLDAITHAKSFSYSTFIGQALMFFSGENHCQFSYDLVRYMVWRLKALCNMRQLTAKAFFYRCLLFLTLCVNNSRLY